MLALAVIPLVASGVDPAPAISQYAHSAWRVQDGVLNGAPTSLAQTSDGYLWIGTRGGLYRFDGSRMAELEVPDTEEPLRSPRVVSLRAARDGSLWIGTGNDLERWTRGHLTHYPSDVGYIVGLVNHVDEARDGTIWMARGRVSDADGSVCKVDGVKLKCFNKTFGVDLPFTIGLLEDDSGELWVHSDNRIVRWNPRTLASTTLDLLPQGVGDGIQTMIHDRDGSVLIGTALSTRSLGLSRLKNGAIEPFVLPGFDGRKIPVQQLLLDSHGSLWIGTQGEGIYRITGERVDRYRSADGLSSDTIDALFEDREGNIWVATSQGVDRFRDVRVLSYSSHEGLSNDLVNAVVASRDGSVWVSNFHAIDIVDKNSVRHLRAGEELPGAEVTSLFEDRLGRMWVGIDQELMRYDGGTFRTVTGRAGRSKGLISSMMDDDQGNLWAITRDMKNDGVLIRIRDDHFEEMISAAQLPVAKSSAIATDQGSGLWLPLANGDVAHWHDARADVFQLGRAPHTGNITSIVSAPDGTVYIASSLDVVGIRDGRKRVMTMASGLPCAGVWSMLVDAGTLWLYSQCGLVGLTGEDLDRWWIDPSHRLEPRLIGSLDGVQPASPSFSPRASRSPDGRLWFANSSVLQMFDPSRETSNAIIPPVLIQRILADNKTYEASSAASLPPSTRGLQIDYAGLSLSVPEKVNFRYRLDGFDPTWIDAGTRRQAFYTNLQPGHYVFRVTSSNNDGIWNTVGASASIEIAPAFYQRFWFHALCAFALALVLWLIYLARIRQINSRFLFGLQAETHERERIARELHDTLLQGMQGLIFTFQAGTERLPPSEPTRTMMESALVRADRMLAESRDHVSGMRRARAEVSFVKAIEEILTDMAGECGVATSCVAIGHERPIDIEAKEGLLRIASEAISNAVQHASASRLDVELDFGKEKFALRVRDDGNGFDRGLRRQPKGHFGLLGIEERASQLGAEVIVESREGRGTQINCLVPASRVYAATGRSTLRDRLLATLSKIRG